MNKVLIARLGVEGGGADIFGNQEVGVWSFWTEGTSIDLDENDDEVWRSWSSEPVVRLEDLLPKDWMLFLPIEIHPDFVGWFRQVYEPTRAGLREDLRDHQARHRHERWAEVLGLSDSGGMGSD